MAVYSDHTVTWEGSFEQHPVYEPEKKPGFAAWVSAFPYGDGTVGLAFDEIVRMPNPDFKSPKLEYAHAASTPVSYCSVEAGSADQQSFRVYLRSADGISFTETGRCPRSQGAFCNLGFPDGRIVGLDVPRLNPEGTGWSNFIQVRESLDGGNTWRPVRKLLEGNAIYLWRARRLRDGTWVIIASFFGTPWGPGRLRCTRTTSLPDETDVSKIQTFFLTTADGHVFSQPHYILPGLGAHEYDVVETGSGDLLFLAGDIQGTPCGRQLVKRSPDGWINQAVFPIHAGAPADPAGNSQGGYVPETVAYDARHNCLLGYRRNKCFSLSNDGGANWVRILPEQPFSHLYQPQLLVLPDGRVALYGHCGGGDSAFGENHMTIRSILLDPVCAGALPKPTSLTMDRKLSADGSHYLNAFWARLLSGDSPVEGAEVEFRFREYWNPDGSVNTTSQEQAPVKLRAVTDSQGYAEVSAPMFDGRADIHYAYNVDVVCRGSEHLRPCSGPTCSILALSPYRHCRFPRDAHMAGGCLYLAPQFLRDFPEAMDALLGAVGDSRYVPENLLCPAAMERLLKAGVLLRDDKGRLQWIPNVHAPRPLDDVKPMCTGDWYE